MRRLLILAGFLCAAAPLLAAVVSPRAAAPVEPLDPQEAQAYADQITTVVNYVATTYVRPVPRHQLFFAAFSGLYEEAGLPVPDDLAEELRKSVPELAASEDNLQANVPRPVGLVDEAGTKVALGIRQRLGKIKGLDANGAFRVSVNAVTKSLDPYCGYIDINEVRRVNELPFGYGLTIDARRIVAGSFVVDKVVLGGPAQRSGIRPGDRILKVDDKAVKDLPFPATDLVRGAQITAQVSGTQGATSKLGTALYLLDPSLVRLGEGPPKLKLSVQTPGAEIRIVTLEAAQFGAETVFGTHRVKGEAWDHWADAEKQIGYIRVGNIEMNTADDVAQAVIRLKQDGLRGLVLDLRWGPGGWVEQSRQIAAMFLKEGKVATIKDRNNFDSQEFSAVGVGAFSDFPLLVLVNGETMGGSELIAAALQDNHRAVIAGQRTFGKASVQTMSGLPLPEGTLKLTTGTFWRPSGKALHRFPDSKPSDDWGVRPDADLEWRLATDASQRLRDSWMQMALRPYADDTRLEMDDLEHDPQLTLAVRALAARLK
jgi:C-terminal peptidase prc